MLDPDVFRSERCTMIALLLGYDVSYIVRFIYSALYPSMSYTVLFQFSDIFTGFILDLLPLSLILAIHSKNFSTISHGKK